MNKTPRYIKPSTVSIGDTIRVQTTHLDITVDRVGTVARREYQGSDRVLETAQGVELLRYNPAYDGPRVTLISRPESMQATLPGMEVIRERAI